MPVNLVEFAKDLKRRAPIEQIVGDYLPGLRRAGRAWKANCPFHEEKSPSFHINPEHGFYHCFGCGAHGDAIKFIQEFEKIDFRLAVETLAKRMGVVVPEFGPERPPEERREAENQKQAIIALGKLAEGYFIEQLGSHPAAAAARDYLDRRGLTPDDIKRYRIGFAPPEWEGFLRLAKHHGYTAERAAEASLALRKDDGRFTDRFRNRIMFPITDAQGDVVGFGGRLIDGEGPKYLNSSDTPLFHKGRLLYGWAAAREAIRDAKRVVILEGYMDWIALHSGGIGNVLAGLGTAFTPDQARLVKRVTEEVVLLYDGDAAGRKAAFRTAELLLAQGLAVRVGEMPEGEDPDSFIRANGAAALRERIDRAPHALDFFTTDALARHPAGSPEGKARIVDELAPMLLALPDPVLAEGYFGHIAARLGMDLATVQRGIRRRAGPRRDDAPGEGRGPAGGIGAASHGAVAGPGEAPAGEDGPEVPRPYSRATSAATERVEYYALGLLLRVIEDLDAFAQFEDDHFSSPMARSLFIAIRDRAHAVLEGDGPMEDPFEVCSTDDERQTLSFILLIEEHLAAGEIKARHQPTPVDEIHSELAQVRLRLMKNRSKRIRGDIRARTTAGGFEENAIQKAAIHQEGERIVRITGDAHRK